VSWLVVVSALSFVTVASAQTSETREEEAAARAKRIEEARLLFLAGQSAYDDGRYPDALVSFERSYELAEDPQILYNIAVTLDRLRRDGEALEAFQMYLRLQPNTPYRRDIEARIEIIEHQIAAREARDVEALRGAGDPAPAEGAEPGDEPGDGSILSKWWFWTIVGVVVAGAATGIVLALTLGSDPDPIAGNHGVVHAVGVSF
jgi:tetratricopeptide (TPR) repeat protein